ncbi:CocE/NonD family hydrolase [Pseudaminobacter salicylatoxidans]|uniref:CocE/NonD family hydrolase n=1 Tax=Pseudaminobacter salicylatoxidans TaxID=93369 RepID=UPI0002D2C83F|nr:CocE/NonD family hydrolase [Pseudaminobacter salicylatoxidans]
METDASPMNLCQVRCIENVWIPMPDGARLAARVWMPDDAEQHPVPALLEYIPYRKRDTTRLRDETLHPFFASHGYASIRVDIRGHGDSDGLSWDEYAKQEQDDGVEIIAWLAKQPWCNGKVGMFGNSWGGFSSLQVAARQPPALKAIITHCSTDDRYTDGDHWMGGCIEETFFTWGASATLIGARPPDPAIVGESWRETWLKRLNGLDFHVGNWLTHQRRDAFWKHASVSEDYSQIKCAVYAVGGWADHFNSTIARMLARLECPRKGLIGPWNHAYPHLTALGPSMDWLSEALRWWDYWLKGISTGIMDEPMYRVWMQHEATMRGMREIPGRWVAEDIWPSPRIQPLKYHLTGEGLDTRGGMPSIRQLKPLQTVGTTAPARYYRSAGMDISLPTDQRVDDARSMTFDSAPLAENVEILGAPVVTLDLSVDKPVAFLAVRLNEVDPEGLSRRVSFTMLNLTHRDGHEFPEPLEPGKRIRIRIPLHDCAHRFTAGNRIRLAVSTTYWPAFWPSPEPVILTLHTEASEIELPVRPVSPADAELKPFGPHFVPETSGRTTVIAGQPESKVYEWDVAGEKLTIRSNGDSGRWKLNATGTEMSETWNEVTEILDNDPTSAKIEIRMVDTFSRDEWDVRVEAALRLSLTKDDFLVTGDIQAFDHDEQVFAKKWTRTVPRQLL